MQLFKYHGIGNDFLLADLRHEQAHSDTVQSPKVVTALCDRHRGVGGDGVLAILPATTEKADAFMRVLNGDGSEAEMCGNGIRCVVKYLLDESPGLQSSSRKEITIDTGAGPLVCEVERSDGVVDTVTVNMGPPAFLRGQIPMTGAADERCIEQPFSVHEKSLLITAVAMGNPHAISFVSEHTPAQLRALAENFGPILETDPAFPQRTNVEFAQVNNPTDIDLLVWERGCGITHACGTGACATVAAACITDRVPCAQEVRVHLLGGDLAITVAEDYSAVFMRGPAQRVFEVDVDLSLF